MDEKRNGGVAVFFRGSIRLKGKSCPCNWAFDSFCAGVCVFGKWPIINRVTISRGIFAPVLQCEVVVCFERKSCLSFEIYIKGVIRIEVCCCC